MADELHFGRAASRLHMTQPPLTQAIAQLERSLDVALFERSSRHVALTPAGEALVPQVRELLARAAALPGIARAAAAGEVGRVRLAFVSTIGFTRLPLWVRDFVAGTPGVALELVEATSDVQMEAFERGQIDAGSCCMPWACAGRPGAPGRGREAMVLALPQQHALAGADRLMLDEVLEQPLVIFPRRIMPSLHDAVTDLYRRHGHVPRIAQQAIQMQTIVNLVWGGIGLAWVPASVMQFCRPGVVYREAVSPAPVQAARPLPCRSARPAWPGRPESCRPRWRGLSASCANSAEWRSPTAPEARPANIRMVLV